MNSSFNIGTSSTDESKQFSISRGLQALLLGQELSGPEAEAQKSAPVEFTRSFLREKQPETYEERHTLQRLGYTGGKSFGLNMWVPLQSWIKRDAVAGTASAGGNFIPAKVYPNLFVDVLRPKSVTASLGVTQVFGVTGTGLIPRETTAGSSQALQEQQAITKTTQLIDNISVSPKRIGAMSLYSKELLLLTPMQIENWLREDLLRIIGTKIDFNVLHGTGPNTPTGLTSTNGVGTVLFGTTATFDKVMDFENSLGTSSADVIGGSFGFCTSSAVRKKWRTLPRNATSNANNMIWEGMGDGSADGNVGGYRAVASAQVQNNLVFFGDWSACSILWYGPEPGFEILIDPYSLAETATVKVVINAFLDVIVRHPQSFCVSTDAGNQ